MRLLAIVISALFLTLSATRVAAAPLDQHRSPSGLTTCKIVTGYGTALGQGKNKAEALENARLTCGSHLIDQYVAQRRNIPEDVKEDLALTCVNLNCQ